MNKYPDNGNIPEFFAKGYTLLFALLPWSLDISFGSWNLSVPDEPLIVLLGLGLAWRVTHTPFKSVVLRPLLVLSFLWMVWMGVTACFSTMAIVSFKYWLVAGGHWWVFGIGLTFWPGLWGRVLPYFMLSMLGVTLYTIIHHSFFSFRADQALLAPMPFFPDHTLYAAVLAILFFFVQFKEDGRDTVSRWLQKPGVKNGISLLFFGAILLSTCRAALLSLGLAVTVFGVLYWRKKRRYWAAGCVLLGLCGAQIAAVKVFKADSGDVSVQERLNRWDCAESMLAERPWIGFGPGTYQFQYLPFQQAEKMTRISVREPLPGRGPDTYGRGGGAHSEYWQAAAEMGGPGLLLWLTLVFSALWAGFQLALRSPEKPIRWLALLTTLGLFTFFAHALANNFLHDARMAALVWGSMASLWSQQEKT